MVSVHLETGIFLVAETEALREQAAALLREAAPQLRFHPEQALDAVSLRLQAEPARERRDALVWVTAEVTLAQQHALERFLARHAELPVIVIADRYSQATMAWLFRQGVWEILQRHRVTTTALHDLLAEALVFSTAAPTARADSDEPTAPLTGRSRRTPALVGRLLQGRWLLQELLDEGGMGLVYQGLDQESGQPVAVKVIHPALVRDAGIRDRFLREAFILHAVDHPNIPRMLGYGYDEHCESPFVAMELLRGRNLRALLNDLHQLPLVDALFIVEGALRALGALHKARIIHRDVKPENLFLHSLDDARYRPCLLDFGVARVLDMQTFFITDPGMVSGTPQYMAPEQRRLGALDHRADYYALGAVLYELLTGDPPRIALHDDRSPALADDADRMDRLDLALRAHPAAIAQSVTHHLRWMTRADPHDRPADDAALLTALGRLRTALGKEPLTTARRAAPGA
jgi:hypothetical protein